MTLPGPRPGAPSDAAAPDALLRDALDALGHRMVILDAEGRIVLANAAWHAAAVAAEMGAVRGRAHRDVLRADPRLTEGDAARMQHAVERVLDGEAPDACCDYAYRLGGERTQWFSMEARALPGGRRGAIVSHFEVTEHRRAEARLRAEANRDPLTGLANRRLFRDEGGRAFAEARRRGSGCALLYLDLDDFKSVNDRNGHAAGDATLRRVARRLQDAARAGELLARYGGDEFTVLLVDVGSAEACAALNRYRRALSEPAADGEAASLESGGHPASFGLALGPRDGACLDDLLRHADLAMIRNKKRRSATRG